MLKIKLIFISQNFQLKRGKGFGHGGRVTDKASQVPGWNSTHTILNVGPQKQESDRNKFTLT